MDGAMGTMLFARLPDYSGCFELLNVQRPDVIKDIHQAYLAVGATIIETNTFGGSDVKLAEFGLADRCEELNKAGALIAKEAAAAYGGFAAGSMGPTGLLPAPVGDTPTDTIYRTYARQASALAAGGADLIVIETMHDVQEARLALLAAKETTGLPVLVSLTFDETGRTMTGTTMSAAFATLAACGADALGANCGLGPEALANVFASAMPVVSRIGVPLCAWPNAGLPRVSGGVTAYSLQPEPFAQAAARLAELGVSVLGGCCGTTPEHIQALGKRTVGFSGAGGRKEREYFITGRTDLLDTRGKDFMIIGERLNPTARKAFAAELKAGKQTFLIEEAIKQAEEGAMLLDINIGVPDIDEPAAMEASVAALCRTVNLPLMIDSDNPAVLLRGLAAYPGVPVVNSVNGKASSFEAIVPLVKRFGCFVAALCIDDTGIHKEADARIAIGDALVEKLINAGIDARRIIVDALMLAESAEPGGAIETLKVVEHFSRLGFATSLGVSNISFGLPMRKHVNNAFLAMARASGLKAAIVNPASIRLEASEELLPEEVLAQDFLLGKDTGAAAYIARFANPISAAEPARAAEQSESLIERIKRATLHGNAQLTSELVSSAIAAGESGQKIMDFGLLSALEEVGEKYSSGEFFLPQMIASANAMKAGFALLKPLLAAESPNVRPGRALICTVKGDVHDIGKNIVAMMLENHGFEVFDLGKDVAAEVILEQAEKIKPDIICLSSLLTTTMGEMEKVAKMMKERGIRVPLMVGGAVVNGDYAAGIGAHYTADAAACAEAAKRLIGGKC